MVAIDPLDAGLIHKLQIRFVNETCRTEGVIGTLASELLMSDASQLVVDERHELVQGVAVAVAPCEKETGHIQIVARGADLKSGDRPKMPGGTAKRKRTLVRQ